MGYRYLRTYDGNIIDVDAFKKEQRANSNYTKFRFGKIKVTKDKTIIPYSAIGTETNSDEGQRGKRCIFEAWIASPAIKQSNNVNELIDEVVMVEKEGPRRPRIVYGVNPRETANVNEGLCDVYGSVWIGADLKAVVRYLPNKEPELI